MVTPWTFEWTFEKDGNIWRLRHYGLLVYSIHHCLISMCRLPPADVFLEIIYYLRKIYPVMTESLTPKVFHDGWSQYEMKAS